MFIKYLMRVGVGILLSSAALAQVDPASSLLVRTNSEESSAPSLDSSRYTVRPNATSKPIKSSVPYKAPQNKVPQAKTVSAVAEVEKTEPAISENKNLGEKVKEIFLGGDEESILEYKGQLHPEDPRQNVANISIAPGLFYFNSSSSYWYRKYHSSGPGIAVGTDIWITPFMGVNIDYFTTLSADLNVDPASKKSALVDHRYNAVGLQFRKYAGLSRRSPNFNIGVNYSEYQMIIPKEEANRNRMSSSGVSLSFLATLPKTSSSAWFFGTNLYPKLKVKEEKTSVQIQTGSEYTAYGIKFQFGQEFTLDRHNQIFWRVSHRLDKMVYGGTASPVDPITTTAPEGVSVTTGASLFELGYTWGD